MMVKRIPGAKDILPEEASQWQKIEALTRGIFSVYNYKEIRPPIIEEALLFNRSLGKTAEIVQKQMFFVSPDRPTNRETPLYVLRPEGTASVIRAYLENNLHKTNGLMKFYYIGPMFRQERPQRGRQRQFHHIGCELIGSEDPYADCEVISLADSLLQSFSIADYKIKINSLGCVRDKKELETSLHNALKERLNALCKDCRIRLKRNTLRILDCKNESCREVINSLTIQERHLCQGCKTHFSKVRDGLSLLKVNYEMAPSLVRGLDYYTRTVFEITHKGLGAQDALGGGGRYDNLVGDLGGPSLGAIGFSFGIERLLLVSPRHLTTADKSMVYIITLGEEAKKHGLGLLDSLRKAGISADTDYETKSLKGAMRTANDLGARYALFLGDDELKNDAVTLKDMRTGEQKTLPSERLLEQLKTKSISTG